MTAGATLLLLVPLWPAFLAILALALHRLRLGGLLALSGPLPALGLSLLPPLPQEAAYGWLLLDTRFGLTEVDSVFLLFTAVVWLVASGFACGWITATSGRERFFAFFLLTMTGNLGVLVAQDMPSFYTFFALMSFAAYGLIVHARTREARHAANVYIVLVVIGEAALVAAMLIAAGSAGAADFASVRAGLEALPLRHLVIALAFLGFGIKAGVLILHVWLPLAHPVAPTPASAVLSGTIIVTGLVGWLRFLPVGEWALPGWGGACVTIGLAAAFYGAIIGMDQRRPKVVLAYSSISQMGIMTVGIGMILLEPASADVLQPAIALFALHHGLAKSALFLGAGLAETGMGHARRRWLVISLALPSLALAGAPFTSGVVVKSTIVAGEALLPAPWADVTQLFLPLTSVATALMMGRFLVLVARQPANAQAPASRLAWLSGFASVLLVLLLPLWLAPVAGFSWTAPKLIDSLWPLVVALMMAAIAIRLWRRAGRPRVPEIPAGDLLLPMERLMSRVRDRAAAINGVLLDSHQRLQRVAARGRSQAWALIQNSERAEALINRWPVAVTLAVLVGTAIAWLAA